MILICIKSVDNLPEENSGWTVDLLVEINLVLSGKLNIRWMFELKCKCQLVPKVNLQ